jgi:hypothetical protein
MKLESIYKEVGVALLGETEESHKNICVVVVDVPVMTGTRHI